MVRLHRRRLEVGLRIRSQRGDPSALAGLKLETTEALPAGNEPAKNTEPVQPTGYGQ